MIDILNNYKQWGPEKHEARLHINSGLCYIDWDKPVTIDIEDDEKDNMVCIGMTTDGVNLVYFDTLDYVKDKLPHCELQGHNIKYDMHQLRRWKCNVTGGQIKHDTKLIAHILDNTSHNRLKDLIVKHLGIEYPRYKELVTGLGKNKTTLNKLSLEIVSAYNGMDVLCTYRLIQKLVPLIEEEYNYYLCDIKLQQITFDMEIKGVKIDVDYLNKIKIEVEKDVYNKSEIFRQSNVNPNSPKQVLSLLQKQLPTLKSTNEKVLRQSKSVPIVKQLLDYREAEKIRSTYIESFLTKNKRNRLHGKFLVHGTWTGRFSSSGPNLQNIPKGRLIRDAFIPEINEQWVSYDYSQLELRVLAHVSKDPELTRALKSGEDLHSVTASQLYNVPLKTVTDELRRKAKAINFGITYGKTEYGLASDLNIPKEEAKYIIDRWWSTYIGAAAYKTRLIHGALNFGYVKTLGGVRRQIPKLGDYCGCSSKKCDKYWSDQFLLRQIMSASVQGSAADIVKKAMASLGYSGYIPLLQVHDEFDFSLSCKSPKIGKIKAIMENAWKLSVPLVVDCGIGKNWGEAKK